MFLFVCVSILLPVDQFLRKSGEDILSGPWGTAAEESNTGTAIPTLVLSQTRSSRSHCFISSATGPSALHSLCFWLLLLFCIFAFVFYLCFVFETAFCYVAQAGLGITMYPRLPLDILLHQSIQCGIQRYDTTPLLFTIEMVKFNFWKKNHIKLLIFYISLHIQ